MSACNWQSNGLCSSFPHRATSNRELIQASETHKHMFRFDINMKQHSQPLYNISISQISKWNRRTFNDKSKFSVCAYQAGVYQSLGHYWKVVFWASGQCAAPLVRVGLPEAFLQDNVPPAALRYAPDPPTTPRTVPVLTRTPDQLDLESLQEDREGKCCKYNNCEWKKNIFLVKNVKL